MDPEQFNLFGGLAPDTNLPTIDSLSSDELTLSAVDSSGNLTMPSLGGLISFGGSLLTSAGDVAAGQESQAAYDYNANLAITQGQYEVQQLGTQETDTLSTQRATYAKAGVTMSGSPLDTAVNTASQFEMDKQIETYNAQSQANMDIYEGKVAKEQADFKASESLLSGIGGLVENIGLAAML